jgi:hypothetical protein
MSTFKGAVVALLVGSGAAIAQGTQQTPPNGYRGGYGGPEPIGNSGAPVATGSYNYAPGPPAQTWIVIRPHRRR